ncbi:sensor histidine kinase [Salana multivorans]
MAASAFLGLVLTLLLMAPTPVPTLGDYAPLIVVMCLGARGRHRWKAVATPVFAALLIALQVKSLGPEDPPIGYALLWLVRFGIAWLIGSAWHTLLDSAQEARTRAALEERQDLARDLHDTVADALASLAMRAEVAAGRAEPPTQSELAAISSDADRAVDSLRRVVDILRRDPSAEANQAPPDVGDILAQAVQRLTERGFSPQLDVEGTLPELPAHAANQLARITEEAVNNIVRHGEPTGQTSILADASDGTLGLAFTNQVGHKRQPRDETFGLIGMQERAAALRGAVTSSQSGTTWLTTVEASPARTWRRPRHGRRRDRPIFGLPDSAGLPGCDRR